MTKFLGIATPRSGTAWLSNFLTYGQSSYCRHEALYGCDSIDAYMASIDALETSTKGSVDTAAGLIAPALVAKLQPLGYRFFIVIRPASEVRVSLKSVDCSDDVLPAIWDGIHWAAKANMSTPVIQYADLFKHKTMRELWNYLEIPAPFPMQRFEMLREILVEDGRIKGFGRFATDEGCSESVHRFQTLMDRSLDPLATYTPRAVN